MREPRDSPALMHYKVFVLWFFYWRSSQEERNAVGTIDPKLVPLHNVAQDTRHRRNAAVYHQPHCVLERTIITCGWGATATNSLRVHGGISICHHRLPLSFSQACYTSHFFRSPRSHFSSPLKLAIMPTLRKHLYCVASKRFPPRTGYIRYMDSMSGTVHTSCVPSGCWLSRCHVIANKPDRTPDSSLSGLFYLVRSYRPPKPPCACWLRRLPLIIRLYLYLLSTCAALG